MPRILLLIILILFSAFTVAGLWQEGLTGIVAPHFQSLAGSHVFVDLVIALSLVMVWIWHDAKAQGRNPWPWIIATLAVGSFGPLVYLLTRKPASSLIR